MSKLFDSTINVLSTAMDLYMVRHNVITDNIANAETPGFKARRVEFEQELKNTMEKEKQGVIDAEGGVERSLSSVNPIVYEDPNSEVGQDRNSVDMDREMAMLKKNEVKYNAATQSVIRKFSLLKFAISEGSDR
ncbi:MAG: flagellar basal body rod protein FlgB [Bdellovibrionaceae bacterium]|nr:flagellar basal body rod protein FlgB [Pseudobdellovibrionaceae bacterium]